MTTPHEEGIGPFAHALQVLLVRAVDARSRRLVLSDPDFDGWRLDDAGVLEALNRFVRLPDRRIVIIGHRFDLLTLACPRFVAWRRTWDHAISAWRPVEDLPALTSVAWAERAAALQLLDHDTWRFRVDDDTATMHRIGDRLDALTQRCEPAFGASTLGL